MIEKTSNEERTTKAANYFRSNLYFVTLQKIIMIGYSLTLLVRTELAKYWVSISVEAKNVD